MTRLLQQITPIRNAARSHDDQPSLERIKAKRAKRAVGNYGQNDSRQKEKLRKRQDLFRGQTTRQVFESRLQLEQKDAGDGDGGGNPELAVRNEHTDQIGRQPGHLRRDSGMFVGRELVLVGEPQKRTNYREPHGGRDQIVAGNQAQGVADEAEQRKSPDAAESISLRALGFGMMFFAFETNQEGKK